MRFRRLSGWLRREASIAVAMAVMNVAVYAFTAVVASRALPTAGYGAFGAMMNVLIIATVVSLGLQATAARRVSTDPRHAGLIEREVLRVTYRVALGLGGAFVLASPLIKALLDLDSVLTAALIGLALVPVTVMGGQAGILQGERRWPSLGILYAMAGVPRLVIGTALVLIHPTETFAMAGVVLGAIPPVLVGAWALRDRAPVPPDPTFESPHLVREAIHNSQALAAFFTLSSLDLILARNVLGLHDSGLYTAGIIVTKAVLFLPQFVVVVAFPSLSEAEHRRRALLRAITLIAALGGCCVLATALFPDLAMIFAGGYKYVEIQPLLWLFAILGTLLSMLQLLIYAVVARGGRLSTYAVWLGVVAILGAGLLASTPAELLTTVVVVDTVLVAALLTVSFVVLRRTAHHAEGDEPLVVP